jgi:hypothetical protein
MASLGPDLPPTPVAQVMAASRRLLRNLMAFQGAQSIDNSELDHVTPPD